MAIFDAIKEAINLGIKKFFTEINKEMSFHFLKSVENIKRKLMKEFLAISVIIISIALLSISAVYFLIEYLNLNKPLSFLIIGIIVLLTGIIIKLLD